MELSNREIILRDLGVLHLDVKVTRPRRSDDETEAMILKEAGISYVDLDDSEANVSKVYTGKKKGRVSKAMIRTLSSKDAEVLRSAGVTWDDKTCVEFSGERGESTVALLKKGWSLTGDGCRECGNPIICQSNGGLFECVKCGVEGGDVINVDITVASTTTNLQRNNVPGMEERHYESYQANKENDTHSTAVNSTYAERELTRLLKKGWSSTGKECNACGMPIIMKAKGGLLECVICGVVGGEEDYNSDVEDNYDPSFCPTVMESPGVIKVGTSMSSMTMNLQNSASDMKEPDCKTYQANKENEIDEAFNEALGSRLFDGWQLVPKTCPHCKILPLIAEFEGSPTVCLRCG